MSTSPMHTSLTVQGATSDGGTRVTGTWDITRCPAPVRAVSRALSAKRTQAAIEATRPNLKDAAEADAGVH